MIVKLGYVQATSLDGTSGGCRSCDVRSSGRQMKHEVQKRTLLAALWYLEVRTVGPRHGVEVYQSGTGHRYHGQRRLVLVGHHTTRELLRAVQLRARFLAG